MLMVLLALLSSILALHKVASRSVCARRSIALSSSLQSQDYEFLDCGDSKRLERFNEYYVIRPCPSATWRRSSNAIVPQWDVSGRGGAKTVVFEKEGLAGVWRNAGGISVSDEGEGSKVSSSWTVRFDSQVFNLFPSENGQIGIFPEQMSNWRWIKSTIAEATKRDGTRKISVLNGFGYTGGSTMAAISCSNVNAVHLDASKSSVNFAMTNVEDTIKQSARADEVKSLSSVRYIIDDCMTFLEREVRRGNKYDCLIFDPPAFGRGQGGKKIWKLESDLKRLVDLMPYLLSDSPVFVLLTCHDVNWDDKSLSKLLTDSLRAYNDNKKDSNNNKVKLRAKIESIGGMALEPSDSNANRLPLGHFVRLIFNN